MINRTPQLFEQHIQPVGIGNLIVLVTQDVIDLMSEDDLVDDDLSFLTEEWL